MAYDYSKRNKIHFAHIRNIAYSNELDFRETAHLTEAGSLDIYGIVKALVKADLPNMSVPIMAETYGANQENPVMVFLTELSVLVISTVFLKL